MANERLDIRNSELPLQERLKLFDAKYCPDEIDSAFVEKADGSGARYTVYAFPRSGKGIVPRLSEFLLEAASVGDQLWGTLQVDGPKSVIESGENLIVLERTLGSTPKIYEAPDVDLD
ncbi:hypothetical protein A2715_05715 [Candidatus Woesebacteria bacterium RIFCSPHIGHO2_01_FULL_39_32]|uniref:Uncharacterized protein n=1 Tax=Candidatus Woesebacteria bacterium RIFCSPLOWO2_01_FULL_39_25 TaxID=1802521 RepID=A0A1F8BLV6_9BACT|nr:MAG: hypothetical protein A2124_04160 [Candidatus Woesebacteria bacterium GWB1_37_5]OGM25515.1 MAG: hypothetical protein A2715_05715 [Candidatus Woesebacteria bacterium RIFCSPHIGHO2_01_FULL_39_32]OGM36795.1 MAG: hypothetical protein A3F01_00185 [Candidatus Woesebacteria bacterium RIFCSPHIGHO2_12_FULL_38_11]OGM65046.1 MAG: hypothetical protein A2893_05325 [Candidatus Woesebacteria bacterium RIFCSPLOWO2_01_FULL_39_25]